MSVDKNATIKTQYIAQPASVKSALLLHTSVSRGHFQVNCISVLLSCKLASAAWMKNTKIPNCMTSVINAAIQPKTLSVTK